ESLSIDTWAVDYVLLKDGKPLSPVYAYRDSRTQAVLPEVHSILPFAQLYARTGIQFQPFNSIYQLYADKKAGRLAQAEDFLMIPEYLLWKLCGVKAREYTNATSTGLVNAQTGEYDPEIFKALGLPEAMFPKLTAPGTVLGPLKADIAAEVGGQTKVVLCATHDTASAVEGIPMEQGDAPFLSSGTWSLLGVKLA
ncbi:FGGY family carbohydrate kinase, partial [Faecalibacterium prausnitzii]